ncbi:LytR family transcriptional regulator [Paenibacillus sp. 1011MAR3C5]|uniref:LCP family protein n=1 Tax=Paenibacillus sp. 1011MAR3C5 TaxID=1675787 RepID=UPI000E6C154D|nr:LCP family protein [Paenibacillus sp. 1011MAR3C5]RJE87682.1 LytR family transcriptional regulator [Paenibacillus sp. 1011MAR3C5]
MRINRLHIVLLFVLLLIATGCYAVYKHVSSTTIDLDNSILDRDMLDSIRSQEENERFEDAIEEVEEDFYMLVIGLDHSDSHSGMNTDTLLLAHVIPQSNSIKLLSIPRDLRVTNLRGTDAKVNSMFASGYQYAVREARDHPELLSGKKVKLGQFTFAEEYISSGMVTTRETIERYFNIDIDYTFLVSFETLTSLVDAVDGIEIDVERRMEYDAPSENMYIRLYPGLQVLDGEQALQYARFRKDNRGEAYHSNDFERGLRQQQVITALVHKLTSWNSLPKTFEIVDIVTSNLKTDMAPGTMLSMVKALYGKINTDHIYSLPFPGQWQSPFVVVDDESLEELMEQLISMDPPDLAS